MIWIERKNVVLFGNWELSMPVTILEMDKCLLSGF